MAQCSFCGIKETKVAPVCETCGALRYPVEKKSPQAFSKQNKLKLSATIAAVAITPGSFIILAALGVTRLSTKIKNRRL